MPRLHQLLIKGPLIVIGQLLIAEILIEVLLFELLTDFAFVATGKEGTAAAHQVLIGAVYGQQLTVGVCDVAEDAGHRGGGVRRQIRRDRF